MSFGDISRPARAGRMVMLGMVLLWLAGCSSGGSGGGDGSGQSGTGYPTAVGDWQPAPRHLQDAGPPPGTLLRPDQMQNAIPRDEPPSRYGNPSTYSVFGQQYATLASADGFTERGLASWYGTKFHGRRTSSGEPYDMYAMTAAHKSLPLPSYVEVTNLDNGETAIVRVNDRGPFHSGRIIDLSYAAAIKIGVHKKGVARVKIRALTARDVPTLRVSRSAKAATPVDLSPVVLAPVDPASATSIGRATPTVVSVMGPAAIIAPALVHAPATAAATRAIDPPLTGPAWYLQVGAFSNRDNAENLRSRLIAAQLPEPRISEARNASRTVYRLRIGPLPSQQRADALLPSLARAGVHDPQLLQR